MDDFSFQHELHTLKERISELSERRPPRSPSASDPFFQQARDLNDQIDAMESRLAKCESSMHQPSRTTVPESKVNGTAKIQRPRQVVRQVQADMQSIDERVKALEHSSSNTQSIHDRVEALEMSFSDLEDKVDGLDPSRFTPPGSTTGSEIAAVPQLVDMSDLHHDSAPTVVSELYADGDPELKSPLLQDYKNSLLSCQPQRNAYEYIHQRAKQHFGDEIPSSPEVQIRGPDNENSNIYHQRNAYEYIHSRAKQQFNTETQQLSPQEAQMRQYRAESQQQSLESQLTFQINAASRTIESLDESNRDLRGNILDLKDENMSLVKAISAIATKWNQSAQSHECLEAELPVESSQHISPPGLKFRDKEIDRMDEQLKTAQETIASLEDQVAQNHDFVQRLQQDADVRELDNRDLAHRNDSLRDRLRQFRGTLQTKDAEIRDMYACLGERDSALRDWDTRWEKMHDTHIRLNAKANANQQTYRREIDRQSAESERMIEEHDEGMKKLQEFCEQKDKVIQRQEQVISRGGKLMQERDDDIEKLQQELKTAKNDKVNIVRDWQKVGRLLEEKDAELADLKRSVQVAVQKQQSRYRDDSTAASPSMQEPQKPEMVQVPTTSEPPSNPWPRNFIPSGARIASEGHGKRRAYLWDKEVAKAEHAHNRDARRRQTFNHPGQAAQSRNPKHPPGERRGLVKLPINSREHTIQESPQEAPPTPENMNEAKEDITFRPPLPAPVNNPISARRMASEANLRTGFWNGEMTARHQRSLSKHQSMQELPKRKLQAYVETEDESGRDAEGHVR